MNRGAGLFAAMGAGLLLLFGGKKEAKGGAPPPPPAPPPTPPPVAKEAPSPAAAPPHPASLPQAGVRGAPPVLPAPRPRAVTIPAGYSALPLPLEPELAKVAADIQRMGDPPGSTYPFDYNGRKLAIIITATGQAVVFEKPA